MNIQLETLESIAQQDFQTLSDEKLLKNVNLLYPFIIIIIIKYKFINNTIYLSLTDTIVFILY